MTKVVVVGSVNADLVVVAPRLPAPGETILGGDLVMHAGGKGGNQAVAAARLGARTTLVAATGNDEFGVGLRDALAREDLDVSQVAVVQQAPTGIAMIVVGPDGRNMITVAPGANRRLAETHLAALHEVGDDDTVVLLQLEIPSATCRAAVRIARDVGAMIMLNAAPLRDPDDPALAKVLSAVDVLVVNEVEASQLARQPEPRDTASWAELAQKLRELGPGTVVVTLGEHGAVAAEAGSTYVQPAFAVEVVDSTGAGDAFCGALAVSLGQGDSLPSALRRACAAGALATTRVGAQAGLPTAAELGLLTATGEEG